MEVSHSYQNISNIGSDVATTATFQDPSDFLDDPKFNENLSASIHVLVLKR